MAPYTPYLTEHMYLNLKGFLIEDGIDPKTKESVHYLMLPQPR